MYFGMYPSINYGGRQAKNIMLGVRVLPEVTKRWSVSYPYTIQDGDTPLSIADDYYGSINFDWLVMLSAQIVDPFYQWPMNTDELRDYINDKYGSEQLARQTIVEYVRDKQLIYSTEIVENALVYRLLEKGYGPTAEDAITAAQNEILYYRNSTGAVSVDSIVGYVPVSAYDVERGEIVRQLDMESVALRYDRITPTTHSMLSPAEKFGYRAISAYQQEFDANEQRREIKLIGRQHATVIATELKEKLKNGTPRG